MKTVELVNTPLLEGCVIPNAFKCVEDVRIENAGALGKRKELKEAIDKKEREKEEERKKREEENLTKERERKAAEELAAMAKKRVVIRCKYDWDCTDTRVGVIEVSDNCCNDWSLKELDLRRFANLREFRVGNECFEYVKRVSILGLKKLESVVIGNKSFTKEKEEWLQEKDGRLYVKDCPKLRELRITGIRSFSDYTVCEIENVDALEVIEIGNLSEQSANFHHGVLELKSLVIIVQ